MFRTGKSIQIESKLVVASGRGSGRSLAKGCRVSLERDENVLNLIVMTNTQFCEYSKSD